MTWNLMRTLLILTGLRLSGEKNCTCVKKEKKILGLKALFALYYLIGE